jgi:hypothetical protein
MSKNDPCICPTKCDCQNPPPEVPEEGGGAYGVSNYCPIHNDDPEPVPECPLHGCPEPVNEAIVVAVFGDADPRDRDIAACASMYFYIESLGKLAIMIQPDSLMASFEFEMADDCCRLGAVYLPTGLVERALAVARADRALDESVDRLIPWSAEARDIIAKADLEFKIEI